MVCKTFHLNIIKSLSIYFRAFLSPAEYQIVFIRILFSNGIMCWIISSILLLNTHVIIQLFVSIFHSFLGVRLLFRVVSPNQSYTIFASCLELCSLPKTLALVLPGWYEIAFAYPSEGHVCYVH